MKRLHAYLAMGLLTTCSAAVQAGSWSLNEFKPHVLPVLVQVNAKGKVTSVSSSTELSPRFDRLLRSSLDEMIEKPAMHHGRPVSSQFVINLALRTTPRSDGKYDVRFVYVSADPVPSGSWYWSHEDGYRLALINRDGLGNSRRQRLEHFDEHFVPPPRYFNTTPHTSAPAQTASHEAPRAKGGH